MTHKPLVLPIKQTQKNLLLPFFGMNFFLAWTEQTSVFQYFGNLTVNSFPTLLQNNFETIISNSFYLIGLLVGVIGWTFIFGAVVMQIRNWVAGVFLIPFAYLNNKIHYATLFITFVFCLTSVPYYGFDYLVSNPLGFVSQDKSLMWAKSKPSFEIKGFGKDTEQKYPPLFLNMSPFDQNALLTEDSIHFYEDFSFPPVQYWNNRSYVRPATISKTVRKNTASTSSQQKSEFDIRTANALNKIYKTDTQLETKSFKPSGSLDLEVNVDTIAQQIFDEDRTAYDYFTKPGDDIVTKTQFWDKYKSNPVYKVLTQFEINSFLLGQPSYQNLNADDEVELYKRRVIFERYLDSIEQYKVTQQPKKSTFAEKVYNQQFKGTFDIVRQFFPIEVTDAQFGGSLLPLLSENQKQEVFEKTQSVLKYDQPLYNEVVRDFNPLFHEELSNPFAQSGSKKLAVIDSIPFYIGWDGSLRKFLVKTNCIPGFPNGTSITSVNYKLNNESNKSPLKLPLYFSFQSWPKTEASFVPGSNALIPYHPISNETKEIIANYYSLDDSTPDEKRGESNSNKALENVNLPVYNWSQVTRAPSFKKVEGAILNSTLPRQRGGLTWPGVGEEK